MLNDDELNFHRRAQSILSVLRPVKYSSLPPQNCQKTQGTHSQSHGHTDATIPPAPERVRGDESANSVETSHFKCLLGTRLLHPFTLVRKEKLYEITCVRFKPIGRHVREVLGGSQWIVQKGRRGRVECRFSQVLIKI